MESFYSTSPRSVLLKLDVRLLHLGNLLKMQIVPLWSGVRESDILHFQNPPERGKGHWSIEHTLSRLNLERPTGKGVGKAYEQKRSQNLGHTYVRVNGFALWSSMAAFPIWLPNNCLQQLRIEKWGEPVSFALLSHRPFWAEALGNQLSHTDKFNKSTGVKRTMDGCLCVVCSINILC